MTNRRLGIVTTDGIVVPPVEPAVVIDDGFGPALDALLASGASPAAATCALASGEFLDDRNVPTYFQVVTRASLADPVRCEAIARAMLAPERASVIGFPAVAAAIEVSYGIPDLSWLRPLVAASGWERSRSDGEWTTSSSLFDAIRGVGTPKKLLEELPEAMRKERSSRSCTLLEHLSDQWRVAARPRDRTRIEAGLKAHGIDAAWLALASLNRRFTHLLMKTSFLPDLPDGNVKLEPGDIGNLHGYGKTLCDGMGGSQAILSSIAAVDNPILRLERPYLSVRPAAGAMDVITNGSIVFDGTLDLSGTPSLESIHMGPVLIGGDLVLDGLSELDHLPAFVRVGGRIRAHGCERLRAWFDDADGNERSGPARWMSGISAGMGGVAW